MPVQQNTIPDKQRTLNKVFFKIFKKIDPETLQPEKKRNTRMRNFVYWTICGWITGKGDQDLGNIPDSSICFLSTAVTLYDIT